MAKITAYTYSKNPKFRNTVVVNLHPSFFKMDKFETRRFGNLNGKLQSFAEDLAGGNLHHYKIAD